MLKFKGLDASEIPYWEELSETDKYRHAENASDVNMITEIFKNLFDIKES